MNIQFWSFPHEEELLKLNASRNQNLKLKAKTNAGKYFSLLQFKKKKTMKNKDDVNAISPYACFCLN